MKQNQSRSGGLHRREFLVLGSTATVGIAASMSASTNSALGMLLPARPQLSIGFADLTAGEPQRLRRADELRSGDAGFLAGDARVTVHGMWRPEARRGVPANVGVSVFHAVGDVTVPFLAWQHSRTSESARVTFTTPIHADGTLPIGIEVSRPYSILAEPARRFGTLFTAGNELPAQETLAGSGALCSLAAQGSRGLKLRRGTYFVALLDRQSQPNWNAITTGNELDAGSAFVLRAGSAPVDFDYLVISIDRA